MLNLRCHHRADIQQADAYMAQASERNWVRGKDLGVTRLWIVVEKMRVDGIGEGACVW